MWRALSCQVLERGDREAQVKLGDAYKNGEGVQQDLTAGPGHSSPQ
jgi:TPR repeat protein